MNKNFLNIIPASVRAWVWQPLWICLTKITWWNWIRHGCCFSASDTDFAVAPLFTPEILSSRPGICSTGLSIDVGFMFGLPFAFGGGGCGGLLVCMGI